MIRLETKSDVERYVGKLKNFYGEFSLFALVVLVVLIIHIIGDGPQWIFWVLLTWGIILFLKASKLHVVNRSFYNMAHGLREKLPFIKADWEHAKISHLVKRLRLEGTTEHSPHHGGAKATAAKKVSKKTKVAKSVVKAVKTKAKATAKAVAKPKAKKPGKPAPKAKATPKKVAKKKSK